MTVRGGRVGSNVRSGIRQKGLSIDSPTIRSGGQVPLSSIANPAWRGEFRVPIG